ENALQSPEAARLLVKNLDFDRERLAAAAADPLLLATDAAEGLARSGTPIRQAREEIGRQVRDGKFSPPWDAASSVAKGRLDIARRVKALRKEVALLRR